MTLHEGLLHKNIAFSTNTQQKQSCTRGLPLKHVERDLRGSAASGKMTDRLVRSSIDPTFKIEWNVTNITKTTHGLIITNDSSREAEGVSHKHCSVLLHFVG